MIIPACTALFLIFTSCNSNTEPAETTGNTVTEDMVDGAGASLDSLELPEADDTTSISR